MYPPILSHCQQNLFAQPDSELSWELIAVRLLASHCEHHPWESGQFRDSQKPVSCGPNKITLYCPHETKLDVLGVVVWKVHSFCLTSDRNGQRHKARNIATPQTDQDSKMTNAFPASSTWWNQTRAYFRKISRKISLNLKAMDLQLHFSGTKIQLHTQSPSQRVYIFSCDMLKAFEDISRSSTKVRSSPTRFQGDVPKVSNCQL